MLRKWVFSDIWGDSTTDFWPYPRAFYFVKWSGKQILNRYRSVARIASKKRLYSLQNMQSTENAEIMQSADHTVCRPYNLQTIQSVNHTSCRPFILQTILSDDHTVWRMHSLQPIWSVSSFLQAIGLGISFLASPEKNALVVARMTVMKKLDVFDASYTCLLIAMRTGVTHCLTLPALTLLRRLEVQ